MNTTLLWILALPILGAAFVLYCNRETDFGNWLGPIAFVPGLILVAIVFAASYGAQVGDTEVWSGKVTSKDRVHGTYEQSYECNCTTNSKGNRSCSTCYETHYTVKWTCHTTIGDFRIDDRDSTWQSVYNTPDPARYTSIQVGDPAADSHSYVNYVQAVPNSLFATVKLDSKQFDGLLPAYPINVYDFYHVDRFLSPGFSLVDTINWNQDISMMLRDLGPSKQVNVVVVIAKTADPSYVDALRQHWNGAKKNDVVLVIGSTDAQKIEFVGVISWTKNELFKIQLTDRLRELGVINRPVIIAALQDQISKNFERRHMKEFEYLKGEIDPPQWLIMTLIVTLLIGYGAGALVLPRFVNTRRYNWR